MNPDNIILGIDLGTTYSCVAYVDEFDRPVVIPNAEGDSTTPSVVWYESEENIVVGRIAKNNAVLYPDLISECVKRDMGTDSSGQLFWDQEFNPEMVSSLILRKVVKDAEQHLGLEAGSLKKVVITCPAYFGVNETEATKNAGELAGLTVLRIMNEPTAAAFFYGLTRNKENQNILVYDLGGGTFDISLISVQERDVRTIMTLGVHPLGGRDWDDVIVQFLADQFIEEHGEDDGHPLADPESAQQIRIDAEEAKKTLTGSMKAAVSVSHAGHRCRVELTREKFNELTEPLLLQTIETTRRLLDRAREEKGIEAIDKLLLVGGSTKMPVVAERLKEEFCHEGEVLEPDLAVAKGAAIIGDLIFKGIIPWDPEDIEKDEKTGEPRFLPGGKDIAEGDKIVLVDVASKSFGVKLIKKETGGFYVDHLIHNQDELPLEKVAVYQTSENNQTSVEITIFEQAGEEESGIIEDNKQVSEGILPLPTGLPEGEPIEVTFKLSPDGRLKVTGRHKAEIIEFEVEVDGVMSKEEIKQARTFLEKFDVT